MNKHDSERIVGMMESLGSVCVDTPEQADIVIFITCCVRESADTRLFGHVSSLKSMDLRKDSPFEKRYTAIGGCIGQRDGEKLKESNSFVDVVFGTHNIASLPALLSEAIEGRGSGVEILQKADGFSTDLPTHRQNNWSAWLPITVGCDNFCSYCIVPYVRGRELSRSMDDIVADARALVDDGVKEITLLGQNVNSYGRDLYGNPHFVELLDRIDATGIERLRFATSHPKDLSDEVIERFATLRSLMPALHLPVQSGSDRILQKMNRKYDSAHYRSLIEKLRQACPDIALSTDVIVGFPGESEQDFIATYELIRDIGYNQVFTFIYSPREGTPAAKIANDTPKEVIQERFERLVLLVQEKAYEANQKELGSIVDVLVEGTSKRDASILAGKSPKNQTVHAPIPNARNISDLVGKTVHVRVDDPKTWYLFGEVLSC